MIHAETEIRKLRPAELYALAKTLSPYSWKILMGIIPKSESDNTPMFNSEHIGMIECAAAKQHRCPAEIFLDEWGTWGQKRPTVNSVINLSIKAELFRTADYLAVQILKVQPPERPHLGPAAPIEIPEDFIDHLNLENVSENFNPEFCQQSTIEAGSIQNISYPSGELPDFEKINAALRANDVREFEINYFESTIKSEKNRLTDKSNYSNLPISDLMKFSGNNNANDQQKISNGYNNQSKNLIEFSSNNLKEVQYGLEQSSSLLPNLEALKLNDPVKKELKSTQLIPQKFTNPASFQLPEELQSYELPLCIKSVVDNKLHEEIESELDDSKTSDSSQDNSCLIGVSESDNLNKNSPLQLSTNNNPSVFSPAICPAIINSQELPLTVLEFSKR